MQMKCNFLRIVVYLYKYIIIYLFIFIQTIIFLIVHFDNFSFFLSFISFKRLKLLSEEKMA